MSDIAKQIFQHQRILIGLSGIILAHCIISCQCPENSADDNYNFAWQHRNDLRLSTYITAHSAERFLSTAEGRREATSLMKANGITKVYIEVYRSGLVVPQELLSLAAGYFEHQGFEVVGGIATVPGRDFGVKQEGRLGWFNWQNPKTRQDLKQVMLGAAEVFDTFIVDDFLCTGDTSLESKAARGDRSWSVYRRELLTELASSIFIEPARSVNPDIHLIIKYPQWYDRFHRFGYDVESGPKLFDEVWVGTETRGQYTQRYGFVQPYEGFVNYRWIASLSGDKIGGAWFDHGDCDHLDFIEQAYQSVLAGAGEIVIFNYDSFVYGHPGHHLLRTDFEKLIRLAKAIKLSPVVGIPSYKPPHSDAGGDLYIMDFIGMFGVPIVPVSEYPEEAHTIFLPTQAVADPDIVEKVKASYDRGARMIFTAGFLAAVDDRGELSALAGISKPATQQIRADGIEAPEGVVQVERSLDLESPLEILDGEVLLNARQNDLSVPFLTRSKDRRIFVLNSHTFSEADFEAVGEVLLCPRPLGLLDLPRSWANELRQAFNAGVEVDLDAPARVTMQTLGSGEAVLYNYNRKEAEITLKGLADCDHFDLFSNRKISVADGKAKIRMPPRSGIWLGSNER